MDFKQLFMQEILPQLIGLLLAAVTALILWAKTGLRKMIKDKTKDGAVQSALIWVSGIVMDVVNAASQTTVKELKKSLADGKITKEEYKKGLAEIKKAVLDQLKEQTMGKLLKSGAAESVDAGVKLLESKIEAAVPMAKSVQNSVKLPKQ